MQMTGYLTIHVLLQVHSPLGYLIFSVRVANFGHSKKALQKTNGISQHYPEVTA
jgi:hypothetical protein